MTRSRTGAEAISTRGRSPSARDSVQERSQHVLQANAEPLDRPGVVVSCGADRGGQIDGTERLVQAGIGLVELLAPQGLSLDGQSLTEPQEGALGGAGRLVTQLGVRDLRLVYKPDELLGDSVDIQPLEG